MTTVLSAAENAGRMHDERGSALTDPTEEAGPPVTLHQLIRARMQQRGWSYSDLERHSGRALTRGRWQQLGSGGRQRRFPDPISLTVIAQVLEVDITSVVLASAQTVGLDARPSDDSGLARLLPSGTDQLSERTQNAILTVIRAAVADSRARHDGVIPDHPGGPILEWPEDSAPSRRHDNGSVTGSQT